MTESEHKYWQSLWHDAWAIMPRHSGDVLVKLLGYSVRSPKGYHLGNGTVWQNYRRGSKPRNPQTARLLKILAGPHGRAIAIAIAIQRGIPFK